MDTLTPLVDWILAASARASLLTLVVLMAQVALRHRVPANWRYALWLPVLIVLLMPAFPESSWSVNAITHITSSPLPATLVIEQSAAAPVKEPLAVVIETPAPIPWRQIMCLAWLGGAATMVLSGIVALAQTLWLFKRTCLPVSDALQRELAVLAREIGLRHVPRVWVASAIRSPAVTGLLRPTLLLPAHFEQALAPHEARLVLLHELTHIKRGDLPVNALLCLLLAVHWFNPLLWYAFFKARLDREAACDAQVLGHENKVQRVAYGHTLLKVETAFGHHGLSLGFVGIFQRGAALRARIQSIASQPCRHPLMKTALGFSIVLLTFLGITKAATPDPKMPQISIQAKFVEITERDSGPSGGTPLPAPLDATKKVPGVLGILTGPQFQVFIRSLSQRKGVDLISAPSVTTRSGQQAKVEVVREFVGPDEEGKQIPDEASNRDIVQPGVTLAVIPKITAGDQIVLDLSSQIVEFEGFKNAKSDTESPIYSKKILHADGTTTEFANDMERDEVRESKFDARGVLLSKRTLPFSKTRKEPIFTERKAKANVVMTSGQTMVLEMDPKTDKQVVEEVDEKDRVISSTIKLYHRRIFVFVTAHLVEPVTGKPRTPISTPNSNEAHKPKYPLISRDSASH